MNYPIQTWVQIVGIGLTVLLACAAVFIFCIHTAETEEEIE